LGKVELTLEPINPAPGADIGANDLPLPEATQLVSCLFRLVCDLSHCFLMLQMSDDESDAESEAVSAADLRVGAS
jgi:hypothetical protein